MDVLAEDRVWRTIETVLVGRRRRSSNTGFINICCPLCVLRGQSRPDRKYRCGIKYSGTTVGVFCFNCKFRTRFSLGEQLGPNMRFFLEQLGVGQRDIKLLGYWASQVRTAMASNPAVQAELHLAVTTDFPTVDLPESAKSLQQWVELGIDEPDFVDTVAYLLSRGEDVATATTYYWAPETLHDLHRRLIIPCYQHKRLVGWTARAISAEISPRYHKNTPSNLLFNFDLISAAQRKYLFIVEGVFDALAIDGIAVLGGTLNEQQITWIKRSDKQIVVVPDRDAAGSGLVEVAIDQGWPVATPHYGKHQWWDADIEDAAAAVRRYGRLYVLQSIIATITDDAGQIRQRTSYHIE